MITLLYIALEAVAVLLLLHALYGRRCGGINILSDLWC